MEASYDPVTGKVTVTLTYVEGQQIACENDRTMALLLASLRTVLGGARPPSRIVSIPPRKRQYAEPAPEAEARARREAVRESAEDAAMRRRYSGDTASRDPKLP